MSVRIITDSAADLPAEYAASHAVTIIPMTTVFGETEYVEGVTISHHEFYEKLIEDDTLPKTSQLAPHQFEALYREVKAQNDTAVVITLSSKLSGTFQNSVIAAEDYDGVIFPVDSLNATVGEQILVKRAVILAESGKSASEIAKTLIKERSRIRLIALLDTLEYLKKGGRISPTTAFVGNMLSIKPVVTVRDGEVVVIGKARGSKKGNNMLIEYISEHSVDFRYPIALGYTGLSDILLKKYIEDSRALWTDAVDALPVCTVGSTIGTHVGPGAIAVAYFRDIHNKTV